MTEIEILETFMHEGQLVTPGNILLVDDANAADLVAINIATFIGKKVDKKVKANKNK